MTAEFKKSVKRSLLAGLALFGISLSIDGTAVAETLKIGDQKGGIRALVDASGALQGAPYQIEWTIFPAAANLLEALTAGAIDTGGVGDAPFTFAVAAGAPVKAVQASLSDGSGTVILVPATSPVKTVADLKGKRVGTGNGSIGHFMLLRALARAGLSASDIGLSFLSPADAKAALAGGSVDAWAAWGPYVSVAVLKDHNRILADGHGLISGLYYLTANTKAIDTKTKILANFLDRLAKAQRWAISHPDAYARVWAEQTGVPFDVARLTLDHQRGEPVPIDAKVIAAEQKTADDYFHDGVIRHHLDVAAAFDPQFNNVLTQ